jgi:hypothetical protein
VNDTERSTALVDALVTDRPIIAAELRPPRAELEQAAGIDAWIDTYHAVRRLARQGSFVFLTDGAVGSMEEDNLRHLTVNLGDDLPRGRIVPFLTTKHTLQHCLRYAERAAGQRFDGLVVLGGDRNVGPVRCVEHAWQLREAIRARTPELTLGGWANPHRTASRQVDFLLDPRLTAEFYLTQIVSHHDLAAVEAFVSEAAARRVHLPGLFGLFHYRSANPKTLAALGDFLPVPAEALTKEFESGASPEEITARSLRALLDIGVTRFYISNLPLGRAWQVLDEILMRAGVDTTQ